MQLRSSILDLRSSARPRGYPPSSILYPRPRPAFTIVELMISIALVVILMVGIHQVFKMSSDTVGMGHALADMARDNRSVQGIFHGDITRMVKNAPLFIIRSGIIGFPANGLFHRHTANDGSYSSPITSQDAFIFYEHVAVPTYVPTNSPPLTYYDPGEPIPANRNNQLAGQWI